MELRRQRIPPNLADHIASQPSVLDGDRCVYICGCLTEVGDARGLWIVCDRHQSTLYQAGRMLNG